MGLWEWTHICVGYVCFYGGGGDAGRSGNVSVSQVAITLSEITQHHKLPNILMQCQHRSSTGSLSHPTCVALTTMLNAARMEV